jgi:GTP cyclohydrolase I
MPQSEPTEARDKAGSTASAGSGNGSGNGSGGSKRRKSKNGEGKKRSSDDDSNDDNTTGLANGGPRHDGLRRSSISKPRRDPGDEPTIKRQKKEKRGKRRQAEEEQAEDDAAKAESSKASTRPDSPVIDFDGLSRPSVGTRARLEESAADAATRLERMKGAVRTLLECVGENPDREGLLATPMRYAKAMMDFTQGYEQNVLDIVNGAIFQEGHSEMVIVKDIDIYSVCEHHLVPFTGKMHIGYIPNNAVIGISKLPRIAEMFARRLQIQERLTKEVANAIFEVLRPQGVAVVMESSHLCMVMRGVQKTHSTTVTSCMLGCFERRDKTRNEFLSLINVNR